MPDTHGKRLIGRMKSRWGWLIVALLTMSVAAAGCAKRQIVVPGVTPEPTGLHLAGKFVWFDLFTHDVASAGKFYEALFGWSFSDVESGKSRVKTIARDGVPIANAVGIDTVKKGERTSRWIAYLSVADVDGGVDVVERHKGEIHMQPKDLPNRGRVAVVKDPAGAIFAVITSSGGDPPDAGFSTNHFLGCELWTTDVGGALDFYRDLVGYEPRVVALGSGLEYRFLTTDDAVRAGLVEIRWEDVKPDWVPYIAVADVVNVAERAERLGGRLLVGPDVNVKEGLVAIIADPTGAVFAIQQL